MKKRPTYCIAVTFLLSCSISIYAACYNNIKHSEWKETFHPCFFVDQSCDYAQGYDSGYCGNPENKNGRNCHLEPNVPFDIVSYSAICVGSPIASICQQTGSSRKKSTYDKVTSTTGCKAE